MTRTSRKRWKAKLKKREAYRQKRQQELAAKGQLPTAPDYKQRAANDGGER